MSVENPFLDFKTKKHNFQWLRVNANNLKNYSLKCDKVLFGCDEIKAISQGDGLKNAPCFQVSNDTNSKEKFIIDKWYFSQDIFDGVSIIRNNFDSFDMYSVIVNYDGLSPFSIIDFKFYKPDSRIVKQNNYYSDITIHWKAFRVACLENFDILTFIQELLFYDIKSKNDILHKWVISKKLLEYLWEYYITRYDYRFDFFHPNNVSCLKFQEVFSPNSRIKKKDDNELVKNRKSWKIYSWWCAWNRKNHYIYVRMYQKQVEILDNWLDDLYVDYINYEGKVWRLEFEFGSDFTSKARWKHFLVDELSFLFSIDRVIKDTLWPASNSLEKMVFEYIWLLPPKWWFSESRSEKPKFKDRSLPAKTRALSMFWGIWKSLFDSWLNPHFYLDAWLIKKGVSMDEIKAIQKPYSIDDLELLNFKFDDYQKQRKERYENIFKNQLGFEL